MSKDEALKMAIATMEAANIIIKTKHIDESIQACKEALEQPTMTYEQGFAHGYEAHRVEQELEQPAQEPVAWMSPDKKSRLEFARKDTVYGSHTIPLYTHPAPSLQGLSDDEIESIATNPEFWSISCGDRVNFYWDKFARAIEQALKEKNHG
jgi:hypothetical protein